MDIGGEGLPPAPGPVEEDAEQPNNLNISDVFEAISIADPSFATAGGVDDAMYRSAGAAGAGAGAAERPYIRIVEQPASKAIRFRYECEGRSAGSIPGANSTSEKKTFPTIEICGHKGRAIVVVSCVTKDKPYRPHPHNLVGRELCKMGVCTVNVAPDSGLVTFSNLGIQCVKRRDIEEALRVREEMRVDPFKTGFAHKKQPQSLDLNAVRFCFQAFIPDRTGKIRHALPPVVSDIIYDKKAMSDLVITKLSHCAGSVMGGNQVILLCEKVAREDIAVTFFERGPNGISWQADAADVYVHRQVAICFTTPRYRDIHCQDNVQVYLQLRRPTDNATSEAMPFELLPARAESARENTKRKKIAEDYSRYVPDHDMSPQVPEYYNEIMALQREQKPIKLEPRDKTPPHPLTSPPPQMHVYPSPARYEEHNPYQWNMSIDNMQGGIVMPGPSHLSPYHNPQEVPWTNMPHNMGQALSPIHPANMGHVSPNMGHVSPNMGHVSPNMGHVSPNMGQVSPNMGHVSPNMGQMSPSMMQQQQQQQNMAQASLMEADSGPSISGLLLDRPGTMPQLNSSELSGLSGLLADAERAPDALTDSLRGLSTADLLPPAPAQ